MLLHRNVQRFRGGLVFKAHRLVYHSTLGLRVIKKKKHRYLACPVSRSIRKAALTGAALVGAERTLRFVRSLLLLLVVVHLVQGRS